MTETQEKALAEMPERYGPENNIAYVAWVRKHYEVLCASLQSPSPAIEGDKNTQEALKTCLAYLERYGLIDRSAPDKLQLIPPIESVNGELLSECRKQVEWLKHVKPQIRNKDIVTGIEHGIKYIGKAISRAEAAMKPACEEGKP